MGKKPTYEELEQRIIELEQKAAERKQVDGMLRENRELLKEAEAIGHVGSWEHDFETNDVTLSEGVFRIFGTGPGELQPNYDDFLSRVYPDDRDNVVAVITDTMREKGASLLVDYRIVWPEGSVHWVRSRGEVFCDDEGEPLRFVGLIQDITKQKESEEALRESEERFRTIFNNTLISIREEDYSELKVAIEVLQAQGIKDFRMFLKNHPEFVRQAAKMIKITNVNDAAVSFFGAKDKEELLGPVDKILMPESLKGFSEAIIALAEEKSYFEGENINRTLKGDRIYTLVKIAFPAQKGSNTLLVTSVNITERKQAEEALRKSEERYRQLFEQSRDAIGVTTKEGRFLAANQAALDLYGYTEEEMLTSDVNDLYVDPLDREQYAQELERKGFVKDYEVKLRRKDGKVLDILLTTTLWRDDTGNIIGYQGINRDITHQRNLEAQLLQSQKMESIGTLAGGIAHSFNNLLMGIQGHASLMSLDIDDDHPHLEHLKGIERTVTRGADLTGQLLGFARKGKYAVKPTDLNSLVLESSQMFERTQKELKVSCRCKQGIWPVEVDRGQIEQMLLSLYVNASQAMPEGGDLSLHTENVILDETYVKPFQVNPGRYVKIAVADTGIGMDENTRMQIFDPFFTTKEMAKGTGLGLSSAYGIVKNHGGIIDVQSELGKGTTVTIYLPASEKTIPEEKKVAKEPVKGEGTILLVDDEDLIIEVGSEILKALGYTVEVARGGKEAIALYQEKQDEIGMVVLDMVMPDMGGGKTYDHLKGIDPNVKVLLASGYSIDGQATAILERGCDGFIQKPFNMKKLSQKIGEILGKE